jgi:tripartite-type tricarboxylate transporter receptor subunit TctC
VPTTQETVGKAWNIGAWRGIVAPKGVPQEVVDTLVPALEKVYNSAEYKEFMNGRGFGMRWAAGDEFAAFMKQSDENLGGVMKEVGLAK